jgi:tetratricopeptide (TPR) repeat protein
MHERAHGREHPTVADTLRNLGYVQDALGKYDAAKATLTRAVAIRRRLLGEHHPDVGILLGILALVHRHTGELDAAWDLYGQALAIRERTLPAGSREIAGNHRSLALVAALRGDSTSARAHLERASQLPAADLAEARFATARAWWAASPRDRPAARTLAQQARDGYAGDDAQQAEVDAWLSEHGAPTADRE